MKKLVTTILFTLHCFALEQAQCKAVVDSKIYIENDFSMNYPKEVVFSCDYICLLNNSEHVINGISKLKVYSIDSDSLNVVCQGVKVRKSKWGFEYDGLEEFFIYDTKIKELKQLGRDNDIPVDLPSSIPLMIKLKEMLLEVGTAYKHAGQSPYPSSVAFKDASKTMLRLYNQLPSDTKEIDTLIKNLRLKADQYTEHTASNLVSRFLYTYASWRKKD